MGKPGVMFYFEMRPCLQRLTREEKGDLFEAILDYGEFGTEPELDRITGIAWDFLKPKLDRDSDRYSRVVTQREYALYAREAARNNQEKMSFEEWKRKNGVSSPDAIEPDRAILSDIGDDRAVLSDIGEDQPVSSDIGEDRAALFDMEWARDDDFVIQTPNNKPQTSNYKPQSTNNKLHTSKNSGPSATPAYFVAPDREMILDYCHEMDFAIDPDSFLDYYTANGWMIGKSPMKDWRAAVRRWHRKKQEEKAALDEPEFPFKIGIHV